MSDFLGIKKKETGERVGDFVLEAAAYQKVYINK